MLLDWKAAGFWASTSSLPLAACNCTKIKKLHNYEEYGHAFFYSALPVARHTSLQGGVGGAGLADACGCSAVLQRRWRSGSGASSHASSDSSAPQQTPQLPEVPHELMNSCLSCALMLKVLLLLLKALELLLGIKMQD